MIGKRLGHYEIVAKIGAGGMGEVYRARDTKLEREVAVKILPPPMAQDPERRARFAREAKAVAALRHPHIVTIHSVEEIDGVPFLTMELLQGRTLAECIPPGGYEMERFFALAIAIADAVGLAHSRGIAHRDLKPGNVVLEHEHHVKVLDFGLAKMMAAAADGPSATVLGTVTGEGRVLGTAAYMAPEQAEGKPTDARSDVFSLGIMFYEMLTGDRPFKGTNDISTLSAILRDTPRPVTEIRPALPQHLGRIVRRCLEKDPERRYESARALRVELEALRDELRDAGHAGVVTSSQSGPRHDSGPVGPVVSSGSASLPPAAAASASMPGMSAAPRPRAGWRRPATIAGIAIGIVVVAAVLLRVRQPTTPPAPAAPATVESQRPPMIVVFPFENLGPAEDAYFAAGVTDEITSRLARVQGLKVLSRTSATQYDRTGKSMQQTVADLGVDYILDGTVRWERRTDGPSRMRVSPQLVRTSDDTQLWSNSYDRSMEEIFRVQSEIASEVVDKLGVALLGSEQGMLADAPTQNVEAYHAFLRGKNIVDRTAFTHDEWRIAIQMFERAVDKDASFLQAQAELSKAYSGLCHFAWDRSEKSLALAKAAADRAMQLDANSAWTHMALGYYHYWGLKDYDKALLEFERADQLLPNQSSFIMAMAFIRRRQGRFDDTAALLARAEALDPLNVELSYTIGETQVLLGNYSKADHYFDRAIQIAPDAQSNYHKKAQSALLAGDAERALAILASSPGTPAPEQSGIRSAIALHARSYDKALEMAALLPELQEAQFQYLCRPLTQGAIYLAMAQPERARAAFETARRLLETQAQQNPDGANVQSALALAYAGLGRREEAVRLGTRALELYPANKDVWIRQSRLYDLVRVYIWLGDTEAAIDRIEELSAASHEMVSGPLLRMSPVFDPLRDNPRFQRLLAKIS